MDAPNFNKFISISLKRFNKSDLWFAKGNVAARRKRLGMTRHDWHLWLTIAVESM